MVTFVLIFVSICFFFSRRLHGRFCFLGTRQQIPRHFHTLNGWKVLSWNVVVVFVVFQFCKLVACTLCTLCTYNVIPIIVCKTISNLRWINICLYTRFRWNMFNVFSQLIDNVWHQSRIILSCTLVLFCYSATAAAAVAAAFMRTIQILHKTTYRQM